MENRLMDSLVFVHGFMGGGAQWAEQRAALQDSFCVLTPDLPGFNEKCHMEAPEDIEEYARCILKELSDSGIHSFHLVGHSMGGMIVQEMVRLSPQRIKRLILYGTGPVGVLPGRFEPISASKKRVAEEGPLATGQRTAATWFMKGKKAKGYQVCADLAAKASIQAMQAGLSAMKKWSGVNALPQIKSPTLVLWGDCDRSYLWSQPEQLWKNIPNSNLAVIPGCAHAVHLEKPGLFNDILSDFLENQE
jgi:2-hydroxy-6-oxonona-2,4-dienedioate hydrolase